MCRPTQSSASDEVVASPSTTPRCLLPRWPKRSRISQLLASAVAGGGGEAEGFVRSAPWPFARVAGEGFLWRRGRHHGRSMAPP